MEAAYITFISSQCLLYAAEEAGGLSKQDSKRPTWAVFGKVSQNMETVPFREKFVDWPEASRLIRVKAQMNGKVRKTVFCFNSIILFLFASLSTVRP